MLILLQILNWDTLYRINFENFVENLGQSIESVFSNWRIVLQLHLFDIETLGALRIDLVLHVDTLKGEVSVEHPKHQNSNCPDVYFVVINFFFKDLGSHVGSSATKSIDIFVILATKSQITNLDQISIRLNFRCVANQ